MAGAASTLFLLDIKGRVLVWRDYRGDFSVVQAERFLTKLIEKENCNAASLLLFLHRVVDFCGLFGHVFKHFLKSWRKNY
ncbi:AP-1 complex subunit mu-2-like [Impatiens glandulifera]|uniref:AP-1 complex subunit mu-2-like n=1 Tax=Impatiens glandulifera TaxID=253017 RepID=UPI001FB0B292|nr:AP-1 complex subunit mu-2-like [Impatiens glandulifera]